MKPKTSLNPQLVYALEASCAAGRIRCNGERKNHKDAEGQHTGIPQLKPLPDLNPTALRNAPARIRAHNDRARCNRSTHKSLTHAIHTLCNNTSFNINDLRLPQTRREQKHQHTHCIPTCHHIPAPYPSTISTVNACPSYPHVPLQLLPRQQDLSRLCSAPLHEPREGPSVANPTPLTADIAITVALPEKCRVSYLLRSLRYEEQGGRDHRLLSAFGRWPLLACRRYSI